MNREILFKGLRSDGEGWMLLPELLKPVTVKKKN